MRRRRWCGRAPLGLVGSSSRLDDWRTCMTEAGPSAVSASPTGLALEGERAVVTGCAHGIGRGIALALAAAGADVAGIDLGPEGSETEAAIRELGRRSLVVRGDTGRREDVERVAQAAADEWG